MPKLGLYEYSDVYIRLIRNMKIIVAGADAAVQAADKKDKIIAFWNCASFKEFMVEIK